MIERYEAGTLVTAFRPMPFHGIQATLTKHVIDGDNDWFTEVVDQGFYFEPYAVHPAVDGAAVPMAGGEHAGAAARVTARS